ncbi:MAG: c-type cytochrome, partial [Candidatus Marinimicrobia bacterium]|nr:c-type cytochrome [Candidatus Neomarinimicrobiota bacterium]
MWINVEHDPEWTKYQKKYYKEHALKTEKEYAAASEEEKESLGKELAFLKKPVYEVKQILLKGIALWSEGGNGDRVDRCMTCHMGINRVDSISEEQPFSSHPRWEVYLKNHPPETFGCVLCHEGQPRAVTDPEKAHGEIKHWLTPMNRGKLAQSSCIKCHEKNIELVGAEELWKGIKLFEELKCFGCHTTEGFGNDEHSIIAPDLTQIGTRVNISWLVEWLMMPKKFRPSTRMPDFILTKKEAVSIATYLWQNSEGFFPEMPREFDEDMIDEGYSIFESVGCLACHSDVEEDGKIHGPNLARIGEVMKYEWLVSWLLDPRAHSPKTSMPDLRLDNESAKLLAAYLTTLTSEGYKEETEEYKWLDNPEVAKEGEELIIKYGCSGCHNIKGMEEQGKIGAELTEIGSKNIQFFDFGSEEKVGRFGSLEKEILSLVGLEDAEKNVGKARHTWIKAKLGKPRQFDEKNSIMPDFRLNEEEIEALSVLLTGLKKEKLEKSYVYKSSEKEKCIAEGNKVLEKYNCMGCHQFTIDTLYLKNGNRLEGMVKLEEEDSLFFQLWRDNEKLERKAGDTVQIVKKHINSRESAEGGEDIASLIIDYHVEVDGMMPEEAKVFTPPVLYGEGSKVQCAWLFSFLEEPVPLRPWLDIRMPTFSLSEEEATSISKYLAVVDEEEYPFEFVREKSDYYIKQKDLHNPGYLAKARRLFESKDVNCASCHVRGDKTPEGEPADWAPDLLLAEERLKPDWIKSWLLDPQIIQPGTKMPKFFREG